MTVIEMDPHERHADLRHKFAQNPELRQLIESARIPRLFIWVPGLGKWVPPLVGSDWDAEYARAVYRARRVCTLWIKDAA